MSVKSDVMNNLKLNIVHFAKEFQNEWGIMPIWFLASLCKSHIVE